MRKYKYIFIFLLLLLFLLFSGKSYGSIIEDIYSFGKDTKCIYDIFPNTTIEEFKVNMKLDNSSVIYKENIPQKDSSYVGSGMILKINDSEKYILGVKTDINGDGILSPTDLLILKRIAAEMQDEEIYHKYCVDLNNDEFLTPTDLLISKQLQIGIIEELIISPKDVIIETKDINIDLAKDTNVANIIARVSPISANQELTWESSDSSIASVNENGKVTAYKNGSVQITVKDTNNHSSICNVTVITSPPPTPSPTPFVPISKRIFVGDSRTVGMSWVVEKTDANVWNCEVGQGYNWFHQAGINNVKGHFGPGVALIILMGVNDVYHLDNYLQFINENAPTWTAQGVKVFFVSVNPTRNTSPSNSKIEEFNQKMKDGLVSEVTFIDTYHGLTWPDSSFDSSGLHYKDPMYRSIYTFILNAINSIN